MKTNRTHPNPNPARTLAHLRTRLEREFSFLDTEPRLVRLTLNEAEALAWETGFPHLFFPGLAAEKIERLSAWHRRQNAIRRASPSFALAA